GAGSGAGRALAATGASPDQRRAAVGLLLPPCLGVASLDRTGAAPVPGASAGWRLEAVSLRMGRRACFFRARPAMDAGRRPPDGIRLDRAGDLLRIVFSGGDLPDPAVGPAHALAAYRDRAARLDHPGVGAVFPPHGLSVVLPRAQSA